MIKKTEIGKTLRMKNQINTSKLKNWQIFEGGKMYQIWVWDHNAYYLRYSGTSRIGAVFALWVFAKHWEKLKLIKKPIGS